MASPRRRAVIARVPRGRDRSGRRGSGRSSRDRALVRRPFDPLRPPRIRPGAAGTGHRGSAVTVAAVITEQARNGNSSEPLTGKPTAIRAHLEAAVPVAIAAAVIGAFYLSLYVVKHYPLAIGWDTPRYLFHANLVAARGLSGIPASLPPPSKTLHARPGFAMVVLPLSKLFATSAFHVAAVVPAVAAIA